MDDKSEAQKKRFRKLFDKLDINKDGRIEASELAVALRASSTAISEADVKVFAKGIIAEADQDEDKVLDFGEFTSYMEEHEKGLRLAFSDLDKNKDGKIEPAEVKAALGKLGLNVGMQEAVNLTKRIDKDGSVSLSWTEWRDFFQLYPSTHLEDMVRFWRKSLMIDIGDSLTCPPDFTSEEKQTGRAWKHLVAGGLAGAISRTFTAPLDRVKIMLQVHGSKANIGVVSGLKQMVKEGGFKSLWRGNGTNVIKIAPESAIKFAAYEQIKRMFKGDSSEISIIERFAAGSSAGAIAQTCIYPLEVIKTRLAVSKTGQYKGILDCGIKVVQQNGPVALFRGYLPNLIGIIPYAGIDLTIYETMKQIYIKKNGGDKDPGVLVLMACGTFSSTCGQLASYPLALVRTRLQAQASVESQGGMVTLAASIWKAEGLRGLYRGIAPNFLKVLPAVSISYVIYERSKTWLGI
ncbi:Calcium-binding mitochondrial carrier protein SCaMC-1 [Lamellibrachia satsuma]|nr:Calcium-binding mitochondrial carrier protein SCaMC-1 [Lamellibrachia satsuma]